MANLFDRLKRNRDTGTTEVAPAASVPPTAEPQADDDVRGKDLRRIAEDKAEKAGEKWRREAEARGEVEKEVGGPKGLEPTRYGDWEKAGRCFDF
jgi:hypothetical protein